jgi:hypothetical protein
LIFKTITGSPIDALENILNLYRIPDNFNLNFQLFSKYVNNSINSNEIKVLNSSLKNLITHLNKSKKIERFNFGSLGKQVVFKRYLFTKS